ncbi:hypothetical protein P2H44_10435 [Albimonas sp. CAU 1670]|uniref:hypothetical protein n=1 Tax=Albimonas sp. CAU 1670 TaxID=3032599 RepID=UPI0023DA876C|nr:hypothetical protein [Albimonas sp. CAU 1670]MDF2232971.1 hypothetical protein [Albimonas sp. CAU 1670]
MVSPSRNFLRPTDSGAASRSATDGRTRFFSTGATAREEAHHRPPPLKAYSRVGGSSLGGQLRARHVAILAAAAAILFYVSAHGV